LQQLGVAAEIPGILKVIIGKWLTASGALAVFVVVYFYSPAGLVVQEDAEKMNKALGGFKKDTSENGRKIDALNEKVDRLMVFLTSPTNGAAVGKTIGLAAKANDNTGGTNVSKVEFYRDRAPVPIGIATGTPYSVSFDTTTISNGRRNGTLAGFWRLHGGCLAIANPGCGPGAYGEVVEGIIVGCLKNR
jgi:Big-like domain-containing protein